MQNQPLPEEHGVFCLHITPKKFNKGEIFKDISNTFNNTFKSCDNIVLPDDINTDLLDPSKDTLNYLSDILDPAQLRKLVRESTCLILTKGL